MAGEEELLVRIAGGSVDEKLLVCDCWWLGKGGGIAGGWMDEELLVRMAGGWVDEKQLVCDGWWLGGGGTAGAGWMDG